MQWRPLTSAKNHRGNGYQPDVQRPDLAAQLFPQSDEVLSRLPTQADVFCVGGAVRDALLGNTSSDRDYVVVGASVDDMLKAGFTPVGKDFPVFLHPRTHDEYALARTERKSGKGYKGFVFSADPGVTLEEDLARRDLTINAIALATCGRLMDPFNGIDDLRNKCLRHVSDAFSEDPVRLLRLARFLARWPEFEVATETQELCAHIVAHGEANALVAERVWQELQTGLMESRPSRMISLLQTCGAWQAITRGNPPVHADTLSRLEKAAQARLGLEARFGLLMHNAGGEPIEPARFKAPKACQEFAQLLTKATQELPQSFDTAEASLAWLMSVDSLRKPERFDMLLDCMTLEENLPAKQRDAAIEMNAALITPNAIAAIAQAAQHAEQHGQLVKTAVTAARLQILKTLPRFSQGG